jgi:RES domain-containing protein
MNLARFAEPLRATAWICRPVDARCASALDLISDRPNRWNDEGEPTIYVSGDAALALIESGRHPEDLPGTSQLLRVELRLDRLIDLRRPEVRGAVDLPRDLLWVLDPERTRALGGRLRRSGVVDGLLVPSAGALDQEDRWNAVVFADDRDGVVARVGDPRPAGMLAVEEAALADA